MEPSLELLQKCEQKWLISESIIPYIDNV